MTGTSPPLQAWVTLGHPPFAAHDKAFLTCAADFNPSREFFIVLFFHGFNKPIEEQVERHDLANQVARSRRNCVLVCPRISLNDGSGSNPGLFEREKQVEGFLRELPGHILALTDRRDLLAEQTMAATAPLVLATFSGGHSMASQMLLHKVSKARTECCAFFDSLYASDHYFNKPEKVLEAASLVGIHRADYDDDPDSHEYNKHKKLKKFLVKNGVEVESSLDEVEWLRAGVAVLQPVDDIAHWNIVSRGSPLQKVLTKFAAKDGLARTLPRAPSVEASRRVESRTEGGMAISDDELAVLVKITGTFETSGNPYEGVSGDFDGQGISCGVLQWNIGQGSLQPLVRTIGEQTVLAAMPAFGRDMWKACNASVNEALRIVRTWQIGTTLEPGPKSELRTLMGSPAMRRQQDAAIRKVAAQAEALADAWAADRGTGRRSLQELAWFFDIVTQNSSMKGLTFRDVADFKTAAGPGRADDLVCDWLAATTDIYAGKEDCHKNANLWRNVAGGVVLDLLVLAYLRSQKSVLQWRGDVLNRKGTLAMKTGWVHRTKFDFSTIFDPPPIATPMAPGGSIPTHVVTTLHLNLRSEADPTRQNVIAVLPQGTPVAKIGDSPLAGWVEVEVVVAGTKVRGHVNGKFLGPVGTQFPTASATGGKLPVADLGSSTSAKRSGTGGRAFSVGEAGEPGRPSTHPSGKASGLVRIIDWFDVGNPSHLRWKSEEGKTFCNVYVYDVCDTSGVYIPRVWWTSKAIADLLAGKTVTAKYGDTVNEMRANYIFNWLVEYGADFGWKRVFDLDVLQSEANSGRMAVICAQRNDMERPGHIQVIAPENGARTAKRSAGKVTEPLQSNAGARNFTYGFLGRDWWQGAEFKQYGLWTNDVA